MLYREGSVYYPKQPAYPNHHYCHQNKWNEKKNYTSCIFIRASLFLIDISMQLMNISFSDHLNSPCLFLHLRNEVQNHDGMFLVAEQ